MTMRPERTFHYLTPQGILACCVPLELVSWAKNPALVTCEGCKRNMKKEA